MSTTELIDLAVIGLGPAGMGCIHSAQEEDTALSIYGLDMGAPPEERHCPNLFSNSRCKKHTPCEVISGFGGSAFITGGKLSKLPAGDNLINIVNSQSIVKESIGRALSWYSNYLDIQSYCLDSKNIEGEKKYFEKQGFKYEYYQVYSIKSDFNEKVDAFSNMLQDLYTNGTKILLNAKVTEIKRKKGDYLIEYSKDGKTQELPAKRVVIATGSSGKGLVSRTVDNLSIKTNPSKLELGARLEYPTQFYPGIDSFHKDLKLFYNNFRSFCVCKGGTIIPYKLDGFINLDGSVNYRNKSNMTNLGIRLRKLASTSNEKLYKRLRGRILAATASLPIRQNVNDYLNVKSSIKKKVSDASSLSGWSRGEIESVFPDIMKNDLKQGISFFVNKLLPPKGREMASLYAPEVYYPKFSFTLEPDFSIRPNLYVIGMSTGQIRGILQSFSSGVICGESIAEDN